MAEQKKSGGFMEMIGLGGLSRAKKEMSGEAVKSRIDRMEAEAAKDDSYAKGKNVGDVGKSWDDTFKKPEAEPKPFRF